MIAVPITASTINLALKDIRKAAKSKDVDLIELRLDYLKDLNADENKNWPYEQLKKLLDLKLRRKKPIIVTVRKKDEGGYSDLKDDVRIQILEKAIDLNADFIDVEFSTRPLLLKQIISKKNKTKIILSYHNPEKTNKQEIIKKYKAIKKFRPDIIKIVTFANSITDNLVMFDMLKKNKEFIAFCMGEKGEISRILCPLFGSYLTFAALKKGKESASGQLDIKTLNNIYRIKQLDNLAKRQSKPPKIFGLVGNPVKHSKGFIIHNDWFKKLKINSIYLNFLVDNLGLFIKKYKSMIS